MGFETSLVKNACARGLANSQPYVFNMFIHLYHTGFARAFKRPFAQAVARIFCKHWGEVRTRAPLHVHATITQTLSRFRKDFKIDGPETIHKA
eukprot:4319338-Pyramimonas_sp.AAC.1